MAGNGGMGSGGMDGGGMGHQQATEYTLQGMCELRFWVLRAGFWSTEECADSMSVGRCDALSPDRVAST